MSAAAEGNPTQPLLPRGRKGDSWLSLSSESDRVKLTTLPTENTFMQDGVEHRHGVLGQSGGNGELDPVRVAV